MSFILVGGGVAIIFGFLWAIYQGAKETGRAEAQANQAAADEALRVKQQQAMNKKLTRNDVENDLDNGTF